MSYPPLGGYYGSNTGHNAPKYDSRYEQEDNQDVYTTGRQQGQYGAYNWPGQSQQSPPVTTQATYESSTAWSNTPAQTSTYDYSRQSNYYRTTQPASTTSSSYQNPSRDSYGQGTQRLNQLVYASGLEPAQPQNHSSNTTHKPHSLSQPSTSLTSHSHPHQHTSVNQTRVKTPVENQNTYYSVQPPASYPMQYERSSESNSNQHSAAAAALAEAVKARNRKPQQTTGIRQKTTSPGISNTLPVQESVLQTSSHYANLPNPRRSSAIPENKDKTSPRNVNMTISSPIPRPQAPNPQIMQQQARSRLHQSPGIADSVNTIVEAERSVVEPSASQDQMPNFIDPTQVFNPYHREYERKKKEAAEAEAKRKAEEAQQAEAALKAEEARKVEEARQIQSANQKSRDTATANSKTKVTKKVPGKAKNTVQSNGSHPVDGQTDDAAAEEMKALMERMISMKSKNPHLFSRLLDDVREKDSNIRSLTSQSDLQQNQSENPAAAEQKSNPRVNKAIVTMPPGVPRNGYKVVVDNNPEQLPDLGRYPAGRRIRPSYSKTEKPATTEDLPIPMRMNDEVAQAMPPVQMPQTLPASQGIKSTASANQSATSANNAWPEPRRRAVAIAAIHLLKSVPENKNNPIIARDIAAMLEKNPSYLDLCAALEQRGLKFQRTNFAKDLLKTVPDLSESQAEQFDDADPTTQVPVSTPTTNPSNVPAASPAHAQAAISAVTTFGTPTVKTETAMKPKLPKPKVVNPVTNQEPVLGTKEAAARKRDFADVLDLTNLSDNDDYVMPSKKPKLDPEQQMSNMFQNMQEPVAYQNPPTSMSNFVAPSSVTPLRFSTQAVGPQPQPPPFQTSAGAPTLSQPPVPASVQSKPKMIIAKKLNKGEAIKKSYYDPKTVARDVLIASGRHPSERPLNLHLAGMLGRYIELDSDVSTFDWDAVDPGGPTLRQVEYIDIPASKQKPRKHRLSRTSLLAIENNGELQTRGSDAIKHDPTLASPQTALHSGEVQSDKTLKSRQHRNNHHEKNPFGTTPKDRKVSIDIPAEHSARGLSRSASRSVQNSIEKHVTVMEADPTSSVKRRGRPPGAKNRYPSVSALRHQAQAMRVNVPAPPASEPEDIPEPKLQEFKCKWRQCKAQLHNIDVLKKHVPKRHAPSKEDAEEHGFICWWKNCALLKKEDDGVVPTHSFSTEGEWMKHIEEEHIQHLAVVYGDGPTTTHTDPQRFESDRQRYLCDNDGREVTPTIDIDGGRDLPTDPLVLTKHYPHPPRNERERADIKAQNAYLNVHGSKSTDTRRRATEIVRAMAARKAMIGPGIDRGGCTLINEARRSAFIQNPGIIQIIDAEY